MGGTMGGDVVIVKHVLPFRKRKIRRLILFILYARHNEKPATVSKAEKCPDLDQRNMLIAPGVAKKSVFDRGDDLWRTIVYYH